ncbi:MAG: hypothetical protein IMY73_00170 [Bacteroidetes bacterium]|nr:hypothetical protein [Bacteroidota bacterium]
MTKLEQYIKNEIVVSSAEVVDYCVNILGITQSNARKRISRLSETIGKVKGICSDKKSILYYKDNWGKENYFEKLEKLLQKHAKQHYYVINALRLHYGVIEKEKLATYTVSPIKFTKGHKPFESVIDDLLKLKIVRIDDSDYILSEYICSERKEKAFKLINRITLNHFHEWARNIGLISYDSAKFDSDTDFSRYQFSMVAPSYIKSLASKSKDKFIPAFVVADVFINNNINENDVNYFIKKLENISMQNQKANFISFLIITSHKKEVYKLLKSNGIIIGNTDELFGKKYTETLFGIVNFLENSEVILMKNSDSYIKLLNNIEKFAIGKTYNLKGDLFEFNVGYFHGQLCQNMEISKKVYYDGKNKEIDIYAVYQEKVVFAECKGYNHKIDIEYVEKWLSETVPLIRKWALGCDSLKDKNMEFELWCTGGFEDESMETLRVIKERTKKYTINFLGLDDMIKVARDKNIKHFEKIIKDYYIKEV